MYLSNKKAPHFSVNRVLLSMRKILYICWRYRCSLYKKHQTIKMLADVRCRYRGYLEISTKTTKPKKKLEGTSIISKKPHNVHQIFISPSLSIWNIKQSKCWQMLGVVIGGTLKSTQKLPNQKKNWKALQSYQKSHTIFFKSFSLHLSLYET